MVKGLLKIDPRFLKPQKVKKFEIFGFDFILDQNNKVWLIEINQSPDAPTFEENPLNTILWDIYWQDIIDEFVLPIALNIPAKQNYTNFTQLLTSSQCYFSLGSLIKFFCN
jgi:tubulin--tyrosine ligase